MKLWVDDLRTPPDSTWQWARTSQEALEAIMKVVVFDEISLDHDLGGDDTTRRIVLYMAEHETWPLVLRVHTMNNVGREWLEGMITRYGPGVTR